MIAMLGTHVQTIKQLENMRKEGKPCGKKTPPQKENLTVILLCACCKFVMQQFACMICYACMIFFACMLCMHHIPCMHDFHTWSVVHAWSMVHVWCACMICGACMMCMHDLRCMHDVHAWTVVHAWHALHAWWFACDICCACMICGACMICYACMMICMWDLLCMHDLWCMHDILCILNPMKSKSLLAIASHWGSPLASSRHCGSIAVASRDSQNCEHALWMWNGFITKMPAVWTMETKFSSYGNLLNCDCIFLVASRSTRNSCRSEKCSNKGSATWSTTSEREEK